MFGATRYSIPSSSTIFPWRTRSAADIRLLSQGAALWAASFYLAPVVLRPRRRPKIQRLHFGPDRRNHGACLLVDNHLQAMPKRARIMIAFAASQRLCAIAALGRPLHRHLSGTPATGRWSGPFVRPQTPSGASYVARSPGRGLRFPVSARRRCLQRLFDASVSGGKNPVPNLKRAGLRGIEGRVGSSIGACCG